MCGNFLSEHKVITLKQQFLGINLCFFMHLKWPFLLRFFAKMLQKGFKNQFLVKKYKRTRQDSNWGPSDDQMEPQTTKPRWMIYKSWLKVENLKKIFFKFIQASPTYSFHCASSLTDDPTNNRINWFWMSKKIGLQSQKILYSV